MAGPVFTERQEDGPATGGDSSEVLAWNQVFIDTLVETDTPNASSQRLGAIVQAAVFDAFNGVEGQFAAVFVKAPAPKGASGRAAVVAAAHTTLVEMFPSRRTRLDAAYAASLARLADQRAEQRSVKLGVAWGADVAKAILEWRDGDGFSGHYPAFTGGTAPGQWRPTPPNFAAMSAQALAFTRPFVIPSATTFQPAAPRSLDSATYAADVKAVAALGRASGSTLTADQTALAPFWEGNATVHWNQAASQIAAAQHLSEGDCARLLAVLNLAMADTAITIWTAKRRFGADSSSVTWRPVTAVPLAGKANGQALAAEPEWVPLVTTPAHPEYPAGHPALNGAAATVLSQFFGDAQQFTLTTRLANVDLPSRTYASISQARRDGNEARVWGGMHYPSTVILSDAVGESIGRYVEGHAMQRAH